MPIPIEGDLNETEAWSGFVPLGSGRHLIECVSAEESKTRKNGHPQIVLELEAVAGEEKGASIRDYIVVIPSTYGKVRQVLEAFGLPLPSEGGSVAAKPFVGRRSWIVVRPEEKQDGSGMVNRVKGYSEASGDLVDQVKDAFDGTEVSGGTSKSVDDDIPF